MSQKTKNENETIIAAVKANRGGLDKATDQQILTIWRSLDQAVRKQYLESIKRERNEPHADGHAPQ